MSIKSGILVILQIITMVYLVLFNSPFLIGFGLTFQLLGIVIGICGILTIRIGNFNIQPEVKSTSLITKGPYKWIRNPMYTAVILFYLPIVIQNYNWVNILVFILLFVTLLMKIKSEEVFLEERFGEEYMLYKKKSYRLIPFVF